MLTLKKICKALTYVVLTYLSKWFLGIPNVSISHKPNTESKNNQISAVLHIHCMCLFFY